VVLRLKRVRNPDAVCLSLLEKYLERLESRKVTVLLCGVRRDLARVLRSSGIEAKWGAGRIFLEVPGPSSSTLEAVRRAYDLLEGDVCPTCPRRDEAAPREGWYYMI
jgi:SulP family sulfate permease